MLDASIPLASLLDGAIPAVAIVVGGAAVRQVTKRRDKKVDDDADVRTRLKQVEEKVDTIADGMFGMETPFGWKPGFVEETRKALKHLVEDTRTNGGSSSKDDLLAIKKAVTHDGGATDARP